MNEDVVSEYVYSEISNTETNILFHKPKSDLCDKSVLWEVQEAKGLMTPEDHAAKKKHKSSKEDTMQQWAADQANTNPNTLVIAHDTLAPLKGSSERLPVIAGLWHEAVADRKAVEVTGAILKLLSAPQLPSDVCSELVVWLDNCGGQNKPYMSCSRPSTMLWDPES